MIMSVGVQDSSICVLGVGLTLVEKDKFGHHCVQSNILLYGASKRHSLLFPQSVRAACILNNIPICAGLLLPCSYTAKESEQMQSAVSPSCIVQLFVCRRICDLNHISTPTVSRQHTESWNSSRGCLEISFPLVIFKPRLS